MTQKIDDTTTSAVKNLRCTSNEITHHKKYLYQILTQAFDVLTWKTKRKNIFDKENVLYNFKALVCFLYVYIHIYTIHIHEH